jgi:hypothetical protein
VHREYEIRLLYDLLAVQLEVRDVQEQRILLGSRLLEAPDLVLGEALGLEVHAEVLVKRHEHCARRFAPRAGLVFADAERASMGGIALGCVRGGTEV